jgi:predicted porin
MNKKLIAAAVAAGLAAPGLAMADATVYGKINVGIVSYDNDNATGVDRSGIAIFDESSRLGFKGEEDLGNGLKAIFKMEGTADIDTGAAFNFNRDMYVGLKGGFGAVQVGHFNTSYKNSTGKMDIFADRWGDITGTGTHGTYDQRENNMVGYIGKFGSVGFAADVFFPEAGDASGTTQDESAYGYTAAINIPFGAFEIAAAYALDGGEAGANEGDNALKVGFQWKGPLLVNLWYESESDDQAAGTVNGDREIITGQLAFGAGNNTFGVSYTMADPEGNDNDCTQLSAGWLHKLSKKTEINVIYSTIDNDANATCIGRFGSGNSFATTSGVGDPAGLAVGIQHNF